MRWRRLVAGMPVATAVALALVLGACSGGGAGTDGSDGPSPATRTPAQARDIIEPDRLIVDNVAFGRSRRHVARAIRDLKRVDLWKPLTEHLFVVKIGSRNGRRSVPDDAHLADAFLTVDFRGDVGGALCDIRFYPRAMADDLARWAGYYSQGLLPDPAPGRRAFWASILGHELAHCLRHGKGGEPLSERWERRALEAVQAGPAG
ncbi:MAG TPA: hypothetical protein VFS18_00960 [Actinomycetota bacterium]|nr:hypothetical protein [Actinomycetota bacterium]